MKRGEMAIGVLGSMIVILVLVFFLIFGITRSAQAADGSCASQQGICLSGSHPDRVPIPPGNQCDIDPATRGQTCYLRKSGDPVRPGPGNSGSGNPFGGGIPSGPGYNPAQPLVLEWIGYSGSLSPNVGWVISTNPGDVNLNPVYEDNHGHGVGQQSFPVGHAHSYQFRPDNVLKPGSVWTFRGFILDNSEMDSCTMFLQINENGQWKDVLDAQYPSSGGSKVLNQKCDENPVYFHFFPNGGDYWSKQYRVVLIGKNSNSPLNNVASITANVNTDAAPKILSVNRFPGGLTDVSQLENGGYIDREVSFVLENSDGVIEANNVRIRNPDTLNFDDNVLMSFGTDIRGLEYNIIKFPSQKFGIDNGETINIELKTPLAKDGSVGRVGFKYDSNEKFGEFRNCVNCGGIVVRDGIFKFNYATINNNREQSFHVVYDNCDAYETEGACNGYSLMSEDLTCKWDNPVLGFQSCIDCGNNPRECDYNDEESCLYDPCGRSSRGCYWNNRFLIPSSCEKCTEITNCRDYDTESSCTYNPCFNNIFSCRWDYEDDECLPG